MPSHNLPLLSLNSPLPGREAGRPTLSYCFLLFSSVPLCFPCLCPLSRPSLQFRLCQCHFALPDRHHHQDWIKIRKYIPFKKSSLLKVANHYIASYAFFCPSCQLSYEHCEIIKINQDHQNTAGAKECSHVLPFGAPFGLEIPCAKHVV